MFDLTMLVVLDSVAKENWVKFCLRYCNFTFITEWQCGFGEQRYSKVIYLKRFYYSLSKKILQLMFKYKHINEALSIRSFQGNDKWQMPVVY